MMLKKIDHIGIAVRNLDEAVRMYSDVYGLKTIKVETLENIKVRIAFITLGEVLIELLEPTERGKGRIGEFIEEHGEGFHHMAFRVENIDAALSILKKIGIGLRDEKPREGGDNSRIAFIDPKETQNVLTELVERKTEIGGVKNEYSGTS